MPRTWHINIINATIYKQDEETLWIRITPAAKKMTMGKWLHFSEEELPIYKAAMEKFLEWAETAKKRKVTSFEKQITDSEVLPVLKKLSEGKKIFFYPKILMTVDKEGKILFCIPETFGSQWEESEVGDLLIILDKIPDVRKKFESETLFK